MIKLNKGDKIAIVSLSNGMLGEKFCSHQLKLGTKRLQDMGFEVVFMPNSLSGIEYLKEHPEMRAKDLIDAFADKSIKGIICAIGGEDTFRLAPYIFEKKASQIIKDNPKFFIGYSDSSVNHLMLYKLGLNTYYGMSFLTCFADLGTSILDYSLKSFENILTQDDFNYSPSELWFEERTDFSEKQLGIDRISHIENRGYELLQGKSKFSGELIGGCIESLYDLLVGERYPEEIEINKKFSIFPKKDDMQGKIVFLETSEGKTEPKKLEIILNTLKQNGFFEGISGILVAKPQNEVYYEEYKQIYKSVINSNIPILYNLNFGHSYPKMLLQYGAFAEVDSDNSHIKIYRK